MFLFIHSQDIGTVTYGLVETDHPVDIQTFAVSPEQDLCALDQFLTEHKTSVTDIGGILLVTGPGSFTASRLSVTMANTIAFTLQIPVFPIENSEHRSSRELLNTFFTHPSLLPKEFVVPVYAEPPHITSSSP